MASGQGNPGQIFRTPHPAHTKPRPGSGQRGETIQMMPQGTRTTPNAIGLIHHHGRIANQFAESRTQRLGQHQRMDQRQPFGIIMRTMAKIIIKADMALHNHGKLHRPGIGATTTVKKQPHPILAARGIPRAIRPH